MRPGVQRRASHLGICGGRIGISSGRGARIAAVWALALLHPLGPRRERYDVAQTWSASKRPAVAWGVQIITVAQPLARSDLAGIVVLGIEDEVRVTAIAHAPK